MFGIILRSVWIKQFSSRERFAQAHKKIADLLETEQIEKRVVRGYIRYRYKPLVWKESSYTLTLDYTGEKPRLIEARIIVDVPKDKLKETKTRLPKLLKQSIKKINRDYHDFLYGFAEFNEDGTPVDLEEFNNSYDEGYTEKEIPIPKRAKILLRVRDLDYDKTRIRANLLVSKKWYEKKDTEIIDEIMRLAKDFTR